MPPAAYRQAYISQHSYLPQKIKFHWSLLTFEPFTATALSQFFLVLAYDVHRVSKKTSTHIIGYKLKNSCPILIIFDIKISHIM